MPAIISAGSVNSAPCSRHASDTASITEVDMQFAIRAYEKYLAKSDRNDKQCFLARKAPRGDGYVRWSVSKGSSLAAFGSVRGERCFYLHHLAWYATGHTMPAPRRQHLSHLCGESRCFNPEHLHVEDPVTNNARKNCQVVGQCPCPCRCIFWLCSHQPRCIPPSAKLTKPLYASTSALTEDSTIS